MTLQTTGELVACAAAAYPRCLCGFDEPYGASARGHFCGWKLELTVSLQSDRCVTSVRNMIAWSLTKP